MVTRFPLDAEALEKGDVITVSALERILKCKEDTKEYAFGLMSLREWIMREKERLGNPVTVSIHGGSLIVHEDESASDYNDKCVESGLNQCKRGFKRLMQVDADNLTPEALAKHDKRLRRHSLMLQGAKMGRRGKLPLIPYKRCLTGSENSK